MSIAIKPLIASLLIGGLSLAQTTIAADINAGKRIAQERCATCHMPKDWAGETTSSLESLLRDVSTGKVKHEKTKVQLTAQEITDVAAYWLSDGK